MAVFASRQIVLPKMVNYVEYIQSSGTQWIDTEFTPNQDTRVEMMTYPISVSDAAFAPYGASNDYNSRAFECYTTNGKYEFNYADEYPFIGTASVGQMLTINHNKNNLTLDVDGTKYNHTFTYKEFTAPYPLALFAFRRGTVICGKQRIYWCKIYDNNVLVRDLWPCYDPDGVLCLYDKVEKKYYYNAGTGEFIAGEAA